MCVRHIRAPHRTTIKLENTFWAAIDHLAEKAGHPWQQWALSALADKPAGAGAASWLRVQALQQSIKESKHG
jgi:predicted DNA-binding ribbon-helix-helix protein